jgi:predicted nucleotidyltransferase
LKRRKLFMSKNLLNISGKINEPFLGIYALIAEIAEQNNLPFFIIGATARDIVFEHAYGITAPRATRDVDLAVQVSDWQDFETLKSQLLATGQFISDRQKQRLRYHQEIPVDIVPFGDIETNGNIVWPPEYDIEMTVTGFQEAYATTQIFRFREHPPLDVNVVTPVGLMALKIIAWKERYPLAPKDALDIAFVLRHYMDAGNIDLFWDEHGDIAAEDHDYREAGARMLGRKMANILSPESKQLIINILSQETGDQKIYRLVENMMTNPAQFDDNLQLLEALYRGLIEQPPQQG